MRPCVSKRQTALPDERKLARKPSSSPQMSLKSSTSVRNRSIYTVEG